MKQVNHLLLMDFYEEPSTSKINTKLAEIRALFLRITGCSCCEKDLDGFFEELPHIRNLLNGSIDAIFEGDPASTSKEEIVFTYPGFQAILYHRVAHYFYGVGQKLLARGISEIAHSQWGIDIAPGATIGNHFFIDHGTGIVIGETAIIGNNVKLYQGATIGAMSLSAGRMLSGKKRHPTVEDDVTIYSNASILGGETTIGRGSIIGANVYLKTSVEPDSVVVLENSGIVIRKKNK
ncbi:MAG: serine O-acetyltransferase [Bacilli bacterium]|nr:serine O-acetyltransferase [Bacilli bacterium]